MFLSVSLFLSLGTTWVSYILDLLYFGETERQKDVPIYPSVAFLDIFIPSVLSGIYLTAAVKKLSNRCSASKLCSLHLHLFTQGTDMVDNLATSPRIIKTHFPVQFVPKSFWEQNCRVSTEGDEIPSSTSHVTVICSVCDSSSLRLNIGPLAKWVDIILDIKLPYQ